MCRLVGNGHAQLRAFDARRSSLRTWLAVVTRSVAVDWLRRQPRLGSRVELEDIGELRDDRSVQYEEPLFPDSLLSDRQNQVMHLLFDRDHSVAEVAEGLGVRSQTVRSLRHEALKRLSPCRA